MGYLPGQTVSIETCISEGYGSLCEICTENGKETEATVALVGETDSWGSEFQPLCHYHYTIYNPDNTVVEGYCDWCKKGGELHDHRDFEEGSSGRVYQVCITCIRKEQDRLEDEY